MAISGQGGSVKVGANRVAELGQWNLDIEADTLDTTTFDTNGWKSFVAGFRSWSGSFEGQWNMEDTTGQKVLQDAVLGGATVTLELNVDATHKYIGTAIITSQSVGVSVDEISSVSFDFQGSGEMTYI
ncbi:phage tail tube protein [Paenibacillus sp. Pae108]|uniref:phage tail tube protein n=1 Tax=Paenibacillus sp. Pae108 TaxID=2926019 RepID=UPI00211766D1|nr:phage tail tube protein [Paenibacillus sp. Pae108]